MRRKTLALLSFVVAALAAHAQVYKWVDENGRVHYGEKPPEGVKSSEVSVKSAPSAAPPETSQTWKEKDAEFQRRKIEREQKEQASEAERKRLAEARRRDCANARGELDILTRGGGVYRTDEKGERLYLQESQRAARIEAAKKHIESSCDR